ncbi:MAG TPA: hypothetical protein VFT65_01905 [Candidatus Angelobacter sp.]|nr:hypothetical protein [Candidatus Angelobacter sp.]
MNMKKLAALAALILGMGIWASAQDKSKASEMSGTVCDQKCVKQDAGKNACDLSCTEHSGQAVFLDDSGNLWKVANPASCKGKMGKKVNVHGEKVDDNTMYLHDVIYANAG